MELEERLDVFRSMLECCYDIYYWEYTASLEEITDNCPKEWKISMDYFFQSTVHTLENIGHFPEDSGKDRFIPIVMSNSLGFFWLIQPYAETGEDLRYYVIGPLVTTEVSVQRIDQSLLHHRVSKESRENFHNLIRHIPIISFSRCLEYARMQYTCVTGEKITVGEIRIVDVNYKEYSASSNEDADTENTYHPDTHNVGKNNSIKAKGIRNNMPSQNKSTTVPHGTYQAEVDMLNMVRSGDVEGCMKMISRASSAGTLGNLTGSDDFMRQMKNASEVCTILFSRASIDGGVPPETALSLTDHYYQEIESCTSLSDLGAVTKTLQTDFVERVHAIKTGGYSHPVADCLDYIDAHLEEEIRLDDLCAVSGYTRSHFVRRFHEETGKTPLEYVQDRRLQQASQHLRSDPSLGVGEIAARYRFCSQSYFTECFRRKYGCSPTQFRKQR